MHPYSPTGAWYSIYRHISANYVLSTMHQLKKIAYSSILGLVFLPYTAFALDPIYPNYPDISFNCSDSNNDVYVFDNQTFVANTGACSGGGFDPNTYVGLENVTFIESFIDCSIQTRSFCLENTPSAPVWGSVNSVPVPFWDNVVVDTSFYQSISVLAIVYPIFDDFFSQNLTSIVLIGLGLALVFFAVRLVKRYLYV